MYQVDEVMQELWKVKAANAKRWGSVEAYGAHLLEMSKRRLAAERAAQSKHTRRSAKAVAA